MKVMLIKDVTDIGKAGDVVTVSEGHGRNYLLPRKLAVPADASALKAVDQKKKLIEMKEEKELHEAQAIAEKLKGLNVTITCKAGIGTRLYGSVTNNEIAHALVEQHSVNIDKRKIHIEEPIKNTGVYEVPVKLHHNVSAHIRIEVTT